MAIKQYNKEGLTAVEIFQMAGIDLKVIGKRAPNRLMNQWKRALRADIKDGPEKTGPPIRNSSDPKTLKAQVAYLKAENDFLAKLRARTRK